ncbi:hypothetical protein PAECIP111802_01296 [Paenibacillus allorhizosphaerae]|uniref:Uncharacterized protein n=1 Tax=Paenibacillus allorhizosphaerae TaxID=2849866 RepID=A0ABM8VDB1_9BACL|nr:hypothetical protein PAECIP111802_01296 [Paenibacillus allorhizosphaerae]
MAIIIEIRSRIPDYRLWDFGFFLYLNCHPLKFSDMMEGETDDYISFHKEFLLCLRSLSLKTM